MPIHVILPVISCIAFAALGLFFFFHKPRTSVKLIFSLLCFQTFYWDFIWSISFLPFKESFISYLAKMSYLTITPLPVTFYHLIVTHLKLQSEKKFVYICYGVVVFMVALLPTNLFVSGGQSFSWGNFAAPGPLYPVFGVLALTVMIRGLWILHRALRMCGGDSLGINQLKYLYLGFLLHFFCVLDFMQVYRMVEWPPISTYFFLASFLVIAYAISRHQLLDIKIVVQKTVIYSVLTALVSIIYLTSVSLLHSTFTVKDDIGLIFLTSTLNTFWQAKIYFTENVSLSYYAIITGLTAVTFFLTGLVVYKSNPRSGLYRHCYLFSCMVAMWALGYFLTLTEWFNFEGSLRCSRISHAFGAFIPITYLHFVLKLLNRNKYFTKGLFVGYICSFVLFVLSLTELVVRTALPKMGIQFYPEWGMLYPIYAASFIFFPGFAQYELIRAICRDVGVQKLRLTYFFFSTFIAFAGGISLFLLIFNIQIPPYFSVLIILYPPTMAYMILVHKFMDVHVVVKRTFFYTILAIVLSVIYLIIVFGLYHIFWTPNEKEIGSFLDVCALLFIALFFKPVEMILHRILDRVFFRGTIQEISTQRSILEVELERRERLKSVGILAAGMAHEIKNPITAIKTFSEYMPLKFNDPKFRAQFTKIISQETDRITKIVKDLLAFSKPSEPNLVRCNLCEIIEDIKQLLSRDLSKHKIFMKVISDDNKAFARVDPNQIKQAFLNIVMNAVDAMRESGGELAAAVKLKDSLINISFKDTGPGMNREQIRHIFDPFYSNKEEGTGLGLAITHSIIEKNNGKITVLSEINRGTEFIIGLPAV